LRHQRKGYAMQLSLESISKKVGPQTWLYDMGIAPSPGAVTVLLGATQAGKTSLMRIMAGLDVPSTGNVLVDGHSVLGMPVRQRDVAMVYQQFINYPSLKVRDNIASPLKLRGSANVDKRVRELAEKLHIDVPGPLPFGVIRWPAATRGLGAGACERCAPHVAGRTFGELGLQAA
jgi:glycerol transport system ATP-binding protein